MTHAFAALFFLVALVGCAGCSKDESSTARPAEPATTTTTTIAPATTPAPATTIAPATTPATATARVAAACGDKPLPPCPLYAWMKANTSPAMNAEDFDALAAALDKVVSFAPAGYTNWVSISKDGASAARAQSLDGVKASCRGCHNQYKARYKKELRDRAI